MGFDTKGLQWELQCMVQESSIPSIYDIRKDITVNQIKTNEYQCYLIENISYHEHARILIHSSRCQHS